MSVIACVSASDLNESDVSYNDKLSEYILNADEDNGLCASENLDRISTNYTPPTSADIQSSIDDADDGDTIILDGKYVLENTITVSKQLTFFGINDATVDGNKNIRLFDVSSGGVIFKNITFINGKCDSSGGAINGRCSVVNCTFINNSAGSYGGAMYYGSATDSIFINNTAKGQGGAMYYGSATGCIFINNSANEMGGATQTVHAVDCLFSNNTVTSSSQYSDWGGGAMNRGSATNCTFINNSASSYGGAMSLISEAKNCTFINNHAVFGGAINKGSATNCVFKNNDAHSAGALRDSSAKNCIFINNAECAMKFAENPGSVIDCIFINNTIGIRAASFNDECIAINCTFINTSDCAVENVNANNCSFINNSIGLSTYSYLTVMNCKFIGNYHRALNGGSVVNCTFINNTAGAISEAKYVANCTFINNSADEGGAIYGAQSIVNCTFINNSADEGGAIFGNYKTGGIYSEYIHSSILNCTFINNSAIYGGAVSRAYSIVGCSFVNNSASYGGAIYGFYEEFISTGYLTGFYEKYCSQINDSSFINNSATYGGAIYDGNAFNSTFNNNQANLTGGAIYLENNGNITYCDFISCHAHSKGGAIYWNKSANIIHCTFLGCTSGEDNIFLAYNLTQEVYVVEDCIFDRYPNNVDYTYVSNLLANNLTYFNGETGRMMVNLSDLRGALTNKRIFIKINGVSYNTTTDLNGIAYFNIENYLHKMGLYNATVSFDGDNYINPSSVNVTIIIKKHDSSLNVPELVLYKNEYGILTGSLNNMRGPLVNKTVIFTLDGVDYRRTTNQYGVVEFNVLNYLTGKGKFDLNVAFEGDDNNHPSFTNVSVYIIDYRGILTCEIDGKYFNDTLLIFTLTNYKNKKPISGAPIEVKFSNGEIVNLTTDVDGLVSYRIPFNPGTYDVMASINQEYVDVNNISITDIEINKIFGSISYQLLNGNKTLMFKLYNSYNLDIFRNVIINLAFNNGEKAQIVTNDEGIASYDIPFPKGTYSVSVVVDKFFKEFEDEYINNIIITNELNCSINFTNNITFDFGEYGSTNFTIDGGIIGNVSVIGHSEAKISVTNNEITVFGLSVGNYTLLVETIPDDYHNPVNATLNINVNMVKSKVTFSTGVAFEYGGSATIHVTVDGGSVNGKTIQVIGHPEAKISFVKDMITVSNLNPGSYTLRVESIPDSDHKTGDGTVGISVRKATAVIIASKLTVALKSGELWTMKFVDSKYRKPISNMKVTLKVYTGKKFKTVSLTTNSKGEARYQTKSLSKGTHNIVVTADHIGYNFNKYMSSIKVIKQTPLKFTLKSRVNDNEGSLLSYTVSNKKTNAGVNGVKFKVLIFTGKKYKTYTLKTKKVKGKKGTYNGAIGFSTNKFSAGKHTVKFIPASIKYKGTLTTSIQIKKKATSGPKYFREV